MALAGDARAEEPRWDEVTALKDEPALGESAQLDPSQARESAALAATQAKKNMEAAQSSLKTAQKEKAQVTLDYGKFQESYQQDKITNDEAKAKKVKADAVVAEKQAVVDAAQAGADTAKEALAAAKKAEENALKIQEATETNLVNLRKAQAKKVDTFSTAGLSTASAKEAAQASHQEFLTQSNGEIAANQAKLKQDNAQISFTKGQTKVTSKTVDAKEQAVAEAQNDLRTAQKKASEAAAADVSSAKLMSEASTKRAALIQEKTTKEKSLSEAIAAFGASQVAKSAADAALQAADKAEAIALDAKAAGATASKAAQWDAKYAKISGDIKVADSAFEEFKKKFPTFLARL